MDVGYTVGWGAESRGASCTGGRAWLHQASVLVPFDIGRSWRIL